MKTLLFIGFIITCSVCYGQPIPVNTYLPTNQNPKVHNSKDSLDLAMQNAIKQDSMLINAVIFDMKSSLYGKIQSQYYDVLNEMIKEYLKQKSIQWHTKQK